MEVEAFLRGDLPIQVGSSNVKSAQFFPGTAQMLVQYHNGRSYMYSSVNEYEAKQFVYYLSKGKFIWDLFRIRGVKNASRKPFVRIT